MIEFNKEINYGVSDEMLMSLGFIGREFPFNYVNDKLEEIDPDDRKSIENAIKMYEECKNGD